MSVLLVGTAVADREDERIAEMGTELGADVEDPENQPDELDGRAVDTVCVNCFA
jgi:hypothetical protein